MTHLHPVRLHVQGYKGNEALAQQLPDDLPHTAKASDDDVIPHLIMEILVGLQSLQEGSKGSVQTRTGVGCRACSRNHHKTAGRDDVMGTLLGLQSRQVSISLGVWELRPGRQLTGSMMTACSGA